MQPDGRIEARVHVVPHIVEPPRSATDQLVTMRIRLKDKKDKEPDQAQDHITPALEALGSDALSLTLLPHIGLRARHSLTAASRGLHSLLRPLLLKYELLVDEPEAKWDLESLIAKLPGKAVVCIQGKEYDLAR